MDKLNWTEIEGGYASEGDVYRLERTKGRRFHVFNTARGQLTKAATSLVKAKEIAQENYDAMSKLVDKAFAETPEPDPTPTAADPAGSSAPSSPTTTTPAPPAPIGDEIPLRNPEYDTNEMGVFADYEGADSGINTSPNPLEEFVNTELVQVSGSMRTPLHTRPSSRSARRERKARQKARAGR